jgi:tetratricopeptide (TPR) repeat protein
MWKCCRNIFLIIFLFVLVKPLDAQGKDIVPYLKLIENGQKDSVQKILPELIKDFPNDPSVIFLQAVLTENGQDAVPMFNRVVSDFPNSKYADASVYRLYSYYFSLGLYNTAGTFLDKLKKEYPKSPYIKIAQKEVPSENETSPEKEQTVSSEKQDTANYKFTIQAGAFSNDANADALKKLFEDSGYYSFIKKKPVGGTDFRVVYVGRFKDQEEADSFLQVVNKQFELNGRVVLIN